MSDPQTEVSVWLCGWGEPRDVTGSNMMASAVPFLIGIGIQAPQGRSGQPALQFRERDGERRLLGEIGLRHSAAVSGLDFHLFEVRGCANYCLPKPRLWARYLHYAYARWRSPAPDIPMATRDARSMYVFYICPRPVGLASVADGESANIFPMNLMSPIGAGYFAFALNAAKPVAALVGRVRKVALSNIPVEQARSAYQLARNHNRECVEMGELPFETAPSAAFGFPVPRFALRVREMQIEALHKAGSHTIFLARVVSDERSAGGPQFAVVHGIYQAWRKRAGRNRRELSR